MSLFQNKEWWNTKVGENEEFDSSHLCIASLDPSNPQESHVIVGSFQGKLRIYSPKFREYRIEDLLYEKDFQSPIIQVSVGYFIPTSSEKALCVLFFKKYCVFSISITKNGIVCKLVYENQLQRNAFNMVHGPFGGIKNRDFICVQSCDGFLMIYEQDKFASLSSLNEYILPSPCLYSEITDSFILQNSAFELESYRYSSIGANFNSKNNNKILYPDWSVNLGEAAKKIVGFWRDEKSLEIFVLTETMLFIVSHTGAIQTQKKLEFPACNIIIYDNPVQNIKNNMIYEPGQKNPDIIRKNAYYIISSFTHHILVYKDFHLIWASKMNNIANGIEVASFEGQKGLIATLNEDGWLEVSYFGTETPLITGGLIDQKEIDYEKIENDLNNYIDKINSIESGKVGKKKEITEKMNCNITVLEPTVSQEYLENEQSLYHNENGEILTVKMRIALSYSGEKATNINILLNLPHNIYSQENNIFIENMKGGGTPYNQDFNLYCLNSEFPYKNSFDLQISYYNSIAGKPEFKDSRCIIKEVNLPRNFQFHCIPPVKNASFKITIGLNQEIQLHSLFKEIINKSKNKTEITSNPNALSFQLANGADSTILVGKNADKIRIQSSHFEGIYFIMIEVQRILNEMQGNSNKGNKSNEVISFQDALPLQDFFVVIDEHFALREHLKELKVQLEQKTSQFRIIQKRMLTRFKDKNATPLNNLDIIFTRNYEEIIELANQIELFQSSLSQVFKKLSLNIEFILLLLKLRFQLTENAYNIIKQALVSEYGDQDSEMNWEEITYANIGFLIRSMNKKDRDSSALVNLHVVDDIEKFKKHLTLFIDKISKGGLENFEIFDHEPKNNEVSENNFQQKKNLKKNI